MLDMTNTVSSGEHPQQPDQQSIIAYLFIETKEFESKTKKRFFSRKKVTITTEKRDVSRVIFPKEYAGLTPEEQKNCIPATRADIVRYGGIEQNPSKVKILESIFAV